MFDTIASRYDLTNDLLTGGIDRLWRIATVKAVAPKPGQRILDLAAGTGTSAAALTKHGAHVVAADFSEGMLAVGRQRQRNNPLIEFVWANATELPFADASFDAATISFGLRNVSDVPRALTELKRVIKPGGRLVVCEFSTPREPLKTPYRWYSSRVLPKVAGLITGKSDAYDYLNQSILEWPAQQELAEMLRAAGFESVRYRNLSGGIAALHRGFVPQQAAAPQQKLVPQQATVPQKGADER